MDSSVIDLITKGGVVPLLVLVLIVLAREYRRMERRCTRWERLALSTLGTADRSTGLAEFFREDRTGEQT